MSDMGVAGYGQRHNAQLSHGESILQVLEGRVRTQRLYLEPSDQGILPRAWRDLDLTQHWLHFLEDPDSSLGLVTRDRSGGPKG